MSPPLATLSDVSMLLLAAIYTGQRLDSHDGKLTLQVEGTDAAVIGDLETALDTLERAGKVDLSCDPPKLTERGEYWLLKGMRQAGWRDASLSKLRLVAVGK